MRNTRYGRKTRLSSMVRERIMHSTPPPSSIPGLCEAPVSHIVDQHTVRSADLVITHALEWPSLTVQWLPVRPWPGSC